MLHVDDQCFFINGDAAGTAFSGAALSLVPNLADGTIALCYRNSENPDPCCMTLAPLGSPVIVTGTLRMLNVDGVNSDGVVSIQPDAAIGVLSLGSIKTADIEGSVDHLIVVGKSDAIVHDGARIGQATLGDSYADLVINANSSVGGVDAPFEAQVSGEGSGSAHVTVTGDEGARRAAPRHAARGRQRRCGLGKRRRRPGRRRNHPAGEGARRQHRRLRNRQRRRLLLRQPLRSSNRLCGRGCRRRRHRHGGCGRR